MKRPRLAIVLGFAVAMLFVYARWIEPIWIEVTRHPIATAIDRPLKIMQLSDLHTYELGVRENKVLDIVQSEKPDVILISGDTVANKGDWKSVSILLSQLRAPLGVFLVRGNWEYWRPDPDELKLYKDSGVIFLNNESHQITEKIWVVGLDDGLAGSPDLVAAFAQVPLNAFRIVLFHSPAYFNSIDQRVDLGLAGHTHGGQLRVPFLPPFWLPPGSGDYVAGWYWRGDNRMYVSRGIGNSIVELRFFSRPEVVVFNLDTERRF